MDEIGVVELTILAGVAKLLVVLLHEVLNDHLLDIFWELSDVNLRSLDLHEQRVVRQTQLLMLLVLAGRAPVNLGRWILQLVAVVLFHRVLLALVSYLAGVEVAGLGVQGHQHVSFEQLSLLGLGVLPVAVLQLEHVILLLDLGVQHGANSRKLEVVGDVPIFKSLLYFLLENDQFVLHFGVDVPLVVRWPKTPKGIANNVAEARLLVPENVIPELREDVLPLLQLLPDLLLLA